jgi:hypothetical protein
MGMEDLSIDITYESFNFLLDSTFNRVKMLNVNIKSKEPLKIILKISSSYPDLDLSNHAKSRSQNILLDCQFKLPLLS